MLVLTRRVGERIFIGQEAEIIVKILSSDGYNVRLGIETLRDVLISRADLVIQHNSGA